MTLTMIKFMKYYWLYFLISAIFIVPGIYSLVNWGLNPSIDFTGGSLLEIQLSKPLAQAKLEQIAADNKIKIVSVQEVGDNTYLLKTQEFNQATNTDFQKKISSTSAGLVTEKRFETLGPSLGLETLKRALMAIAVAVLAILIFIWIQFKDKKYGICAVLAMFHDSLVILGIFSLLGHFWGVEVDTLFVTALLTSLSFSVHDTVVVYDRIRETIKNHPKADFETVVNKALSETMSRSVNNSLTIIFMLTCLWLLGGQSIKWFVFALLIGTISGTYSSPFVATPLLVVWERIKRRKLK